MPISNHINRLDASRYDAKLQLTDGLIHEPGHHPAFFMLPLTMRNLLLVLNTWCLVLCVANQAGYGQVTVAETDQGVRVSENDQPILVYRHRPVSLEGQFTRANYVHPLYDLDGNVITEDFPDDHPHQRGIFWAWHQVIVGDQLAGDSWLTEDFNWDVASIDIAEHEYGAASLQAEVIWSSPRITGDDGEPRPLVRETTSIRAYPRVKDMRQIDFAIQLVALVEDLSIGGSDDEKGYGGFSVRFVLPDDLRFQATAGDVTPQRPACPSGVRRLSPALDLA